MPTVTKQDSAATMEVYNAVQDVLDQYSVDGVGFETIYSEGDSILETLRRRCSIPSSPASS